MTTTVIGTCGQKTDGVTGGPVTCPSGYTFNEDAASMVLSVIGGSSADTMKCCYLVPTTTPCATTTVMPTTTTPCMTTTVIPTTTTPCMTTTVMPTTTTPCMTTTVIGTCGQKTDGVTGGPVTCPSGYTFNEDAASMVL